MFYQGWLDEGISIETMQKFNIRWYEKEKHIIIPHYNFNGELIGIRRRSLQEKDKDNKYMPEIIESVQYSHSLNLNLYGLNMHIKGILKTKKIVIVESEKSVMLAHDYYGEDAFVVATCGFNISNWQRDMILSLTRFLYAQSIPLIGHTASKDIAKYCNNSLDQFRMTVDMDVKPFIKLSGFGEEMSKSIKKWWNTHHEEFCDLAQEFNFKEEVLVNKSDVLKNKVFVITGSVHHFANRDALKNKIESLGGKVSGSVSAKTSYLINNDNTSKSSKNVKAVQLNIPIITEDDFLNMLWAILFYQLLHNNTGALLFQK